MRNNELLPYDTIVQATSGEPEAVNTVLQYYGRRIRYASRISGQADKEAEDFITETLLKALFRLSCEFQDGKTILQDEAQRRQSH